MMAPQSPYARSKSFVKPPHWELENRAPVAARKEREVGPKEDTQKRISKANKDRAATSKAHRQNMDALPVNTEKSSYGARTEKEELAQAYAAGRGREYAEKMASLEAGLKKARAVRTLAESRLREEQHAQKRREAMEKARTVRTVAENRLSEEHAQKRREDMEKADKVSSIGKPVTEEAHNEKDDGLRGKVARANRKKAYEERVAATKAAKARDRAAKEKEYRKQEEAADAELLRWREEEAQRDFARRVSVFRAPTNHPKAEKERASRFMAEKAKQALVKAIALNRKEELDKVKKDLSDSNDTPKEDKKDV